MLTCSNVSLCFDISFKAANVRMEEHVQKKVIVHVHEVIQDVCVKLKWKVGYLLVLYFPTNDLQI